MKDYFSEIERLSKITNGDDGLYNDPQKGDYVIIQKDGMLIGMPRAAFEAFEKSEKYKHEKPKKKVDPYYMKHRKSRW